MSRTNDLGGEQFWGFGNGSEYPLKQTLPQWMETVKRFSKGVANETGRRYMVFGGLIPGFLVASFGSMMMRLYTLLLGLAPSEKTQIIYGPLICYELFWRRKNGRSGVARFFGFRPHSHRILWPNNRARVVAL